MYEIFEKMLQDKGVKVADVCRATGIRSGTMTDWKMGRSTPKQDKIQKIADYFDVDISVFYGAEPQESEKKTYYLDDETVRLAQALKDNPDLHAMLKAAKDVNPNDIRNLTNILYSLKGTNRDG